MTERASSAAAAHVVGGGAFVRYDGEGADEDVARVRIVVVFEDDDDDESSDDVVKAKAFIHRRLVFVVVVALAGRFTSSHRRNLQFASDVIDGCVVDIDIARTTALVGVVCRARSKKDAGSIEEIPGGMRESERGNTHELWVSCPNFAVFCVSRAFDVIWPLIGGFFLLIRTEPTTTPKLATIWDLHIVGVSGR